MKQSVDLMNSMKPMNSRHSNTCYRHSNTVTGFARRISTAVLPALARRAMLLLSILLMSVGSAWGATITSWNTTGDATQTITKYAKNTGLQSYTLPVPISEISTAVPGLTSDNIYVRWSAKKAGSKVDLNGSSWDDLKINAVSSSYAWNYGTQNGYYIYGVNTCSLTSVEEILGVTVSYSPYSSYTLDDFIFEYYISTNRAEINSSTNEPSTFDLKVEVIFNATGKKPDTFINGKSSSCIERSNTITLKPENGYNSAENSITISSLPANWPAVNAKYVRWFVIDGTDDAVNDSKDWLTQPADFVSDSEGSHGWYWFSDTPMSTSSLSISKLTIGAGKNLEDYRLIAVFSDEEGTLSGTDLTKEPEYDYWYTFSFEHPFKAETISNIIEKTLTVGPTDWLQNLKVTFDYTTSEIKLLDQYSVELSKASIAETLWETSGYSGGTLSAPFYVRWFLQDAVTGNEKYIAGALVDEIPLPMKYQRKTAMDCIGVVPESQSRISLISCR